MNTSTRLTRYLTESSIAYQEMRHFHSNSSLGTAITANIPLKQIAKAVSSKNHEDKKLMAILPAAHKINLSVLNDNFHGSFSLMKEQDVYQLFSDCNQGAVPLASKAYNLSMVCERELDQLAEYILKQATIRPYFVFDKTSLKH